MGAGCGQEAERHRARVGGWGSDRHRDEEETVTERVVDEELETEREPEETGRKRQDKGALSSLGR